MKRILVHVLLSFLISLCVLILGIALFAMACDLDVWPLVETALVNFFLWLWVFVFSSVEVLHRTQHSGFRVERKWLIGVIFGGIALAASINLGMLSALLNRGNDFWFYGIMLAIFLISVALVLLVSGYDRRKYETES